ncbi:MULTISPECIES: hypothetical protein [unclassified Azospirillum]|uniref:hypothetical protein n=1 Tax=unclassified Azospirillum TaxID=2630922 RepID=UPI000B65B820|nr:MULTISPECIES: hypothetical protein [unclassified Azospirillum]SNR83617.1 hypothetical protein SAMN05880556_10122 [Azospirillum sp. RU38E]SNR99141.1 hypothetical protein SAMN05880591_10122 [Azospirillum sp. RU37A]
MYDRLTRPAPPKPSALAPRTAQNQPTRPKDGLPAGLRLLDDARHDVALGEILAALSAQSAEPPASTRLREVEDAIRRHWAVLRNLVREHAELSQQGLRNPVEDSLPPVRPKKATLYTPPRRVVAAE